MAQPCRPRGPAGPRLHGHPLRSRCAGFTTECPGVGGVSARPARPDCGARSPGVPPAALLQAGSAWSHLAVARGDSPGPLSCPVKVVPAAHSTDPPPAAPSRQLEGRPTGLLRFPSGNISSDGSLWGRPCNSHEAKTQVRVLPRASRGPVTCLQCGRVTNAP